MHSCRKVRNQTNYPSVFVRLTREPVDFLPTLLGFTGGCNIRTASLRGIPGISPVRAWAAEIARYSMVRLKLSSTICCPNLGLRQLGMQVSNENKFSMCSQRSQSFKRDSRLMFIDWFQDLIWMNYELIIPTPQPCLVALGEVRRTPIRTCGPEEWQNAWRLGSGIYRPRTSIQPTTCSAKIMMKTFPNRG